MLSSATKTQVFIARKCPVCCGRRRTRPSLRSELPLPLIFKASRLLHRYCKGSSDAQLMKWWAQYCESQGKFDEALAVYVLGNDVASQVQTACCATRGVLNPFLVLC